MRRERSRRLPEPVLGSAAIGYARVQHVVNGGDEEEISRALLEFRDRHDGVVRPSNASARAAPFVRLGLLRESPGAAPVFAPVLYAKAFRLLDGRRYVEAVAAFQRALESQNEARDELYSPGVGRELRRVGTT